MNVFLQIANKLGFQKKKNLHTYDVTRQWRKGRLLTWSYDRFTPGKQSLGRMDPRAGLNAMKKKETFLSSRKANMNFSYVQSAD
jgi:hypothetical protein